LKRALQSELINNKVCISLSIAEGKIVDKEPQNRA
jgi:hypothetical protein